MSSTLQRNSEYRDSSSALSSVPDDVERGSDNPELNAPNAIKRSATNTGLRNPRKKFKSSTSIELEEQAGVKEPNRSKTRGKQDEGLAQLKLATTKRQRTTKAKKEAVAVDNAGNFSPAPETKRASAKSKKADKGSTQESDQDAKRSKEEKSKTEGRRKRKTKEEKEAETMPLAARTIGSNMLIGAHVSSAGGVHNSVANCVHIGGNAFALFLKSQRKWENPPLQEDQISQFHAQCKEHSYSANAHVLPHGSYLVNLAAAEPARATQAYNAFLDDVRRCASLGIQHYNIHPGNTNGLPRAEAIGRIAAALNRANAETKGTGVTTLLENMAASPTTSNTIGGAFEDLRDIISLVDDKSRVGVTLDTCHAFAAGYDLRTTEAYADVMSEFDAVVGKEYLKAVHVNDSKAPLGSHRDLHQNIGLGFLGLRAFHNLVNDARFASVPLVLETPIERKDSTTGKSIEDKGVWAREIKLLESLVGMDPTGDEFKRLEEDLADEGLEEKKKYQASHEKKVEKEKKKANKADAGRRLKGNRSKTKNNETDSASSSGENFE